MSPRAAWRLEALGYPQVYDYVVGKSDWMAAGLPTVRGDPRSRVIDILDPAVGTCGPAERVADVAARMAATGAQLCVVVNDHRVVQGRLRLGHLDADHDALVGDVMEPGPTTVRADADAAETSARMKERGATSLIVANPDGVLLGVVWSVVDGE